MAKRYFPKEIEEKWSKKWQEDKIYTPDLSQAEKPFYNLMMFPYPSAAGLHIGNMYAFTGSDVYGRFERMQGWSVFEPVGLDGFGIHSENYALKINRHPVIVSKETEQHFYQQLKTIGNGYDWTRTVETYKPNYYRWTQWLFLQMYQHGLAYRKKAEVNWCSSCRTVLSDEQVISGECERCRTKVENKDLEQWFFKITQYADRLLTNLDKIDWSEKVKIMQRNWIGKSEGTLIKFPIVGAIHESPLQVFTTRPDTLFGATFVVISPYHPLLSWLVVPEKQSEISSYLEKIATAPKVEMLEKNLEKTGVFTGSFATNPINGAEVPIWIADYVLLAYGTGAVMAVPASDQRDFDFAKKYNLPIKEVEREGRLVNSGEFTGLDNLAAKQKITDYLIEHQLGTRETHYHLRDWLISRQRYWGSPIPIIYCKNCYGQLKTGPTLEGVDYVVRDGEKWAIIPVPEKDLPIELPYLKNFRPTGTGQAPLASDSDFVNTKCPVCGSPAKRETDVSDTFLDSSWYYLRYPSTDIQDKPFDKLRVDKWLPVDMYIGGSEHAVLHLMYSRFVTMALHDFGLLAFDEPFTKFRAHGLIISGGAKMSKSKGNVVNPDELTNEYGADTLRTYLMFMGPLSEGGDFQKIAVGGVYRFLGRVWDLVYTVGVRSSDPKQGREDPAPTEEKRKLNQTIKRVTQGIEDLHYNVSIAALMELLNFLSKQKTLSLETIKSFLLILAPFAPFITEELWSQLKQAYSIHQQSWPKIDNKYLQEEKMVIAVSVNGKVRDQLVIQSDTVNNEKEIVKTVLQSPKIIKYTSEKKIVKTYYVPGRILNLVVEDK